MCSKMNIVLLNHFIRFKILLHGKLGEELFQIWYWNSYSDSSVLIPAPFSQNDNFSIPFPPPSTGLLSTVKNASHLFPCVLPPHPSVSSFHTLIVIRVPLCALTPSSGELNSYSWKLFVIGWHLNEDVYETYWDVFIDLICIDLFILGLCSLIIFLLQCWITPILIQKSNCKKLVICILHYCVTV